MRGRSVNEESGMPPIKQPPPGPTHVQSINDNLTPTFNSLPPYICQSTLEASSSIAAHTSSELDTGQGEMIDETIKHGTHKLHQTILTLGICTTNPKRTAGTGNTESINILRIIDIWTPAITDSPRQDSTTAFQLPRNTSLCPTSTDPKNAIHIKVNWPPGENTTPTLTSFEQTKQIIMDIDTLSHSDALCNKILQSLNLNGLCKYDSLHKAYTFEQSSIPVNCSHIFIFLKTLAC